VAKFEGEGVAHAEDHESTQAHEAGRRTTRFDVEKRSSARWDSVKFSCENTVMLNMSIKVSCEVTRFSSMTRWFEETIVGQKRQSERGFNGFNGVYTNTSES
jgi:hypothetical protein